jgi:hypothetical protein
VTKNLVRRLHGEHPGQHPLDEGLDGTISAKRLGLPRELERELSTTNAIENLIGRGPPVLSGTFRDFHAERDAIARRVLPALDEELAALRCTSRSSTCGLA